MNASFEVDCGPLDELNKEYFAVLEGGKTVFCRAEEDGSLAYMDRASFLFETGTRQVKLGTRRDGSDVLEAAGAVWLRWPGRRYYKRGFALKPDGCGPDHYNLWKGFGVQPAAGDWSLMRRHIAEIICDGDAALSDYVIKWCAWKIQRPLARPLVALVLRGEEGTGKGIFGEALKGIFGAHAAYVNQAESVVGRFNGLMRGKLFVYCDEVSWGTSESSIGRLKSQITEPTITIERKGIDGVMEENHCAFLFTTNDQWAIPVGKEGRRFVVCNVSDRKRTNGGYFAALIAERDRGGLAAMLHELRGMELGDFHPERDRPDNAALHEQKAETLRRQGTFAAAWMEMLDSGVLPTGSPNPDGSVFIETARLQRHFAEEGRSHRVNHKSIGAAFGSTGMRFPNPRCGGGRGWMVPPLEEARAAFNRWQFPVEWDEGATVWEVLERRLPGVTHAAQPYEKGPF